MKKWFIALLLTIPLAGCVSLAKQQLRAGKRDFQHRRYQAAAGHIASSAEQGNAEAQYVLGYLFYYGKGLPHDYQAAHYWIAQSAKQRYLKAMVALKMFKQAKYAAPEESHARVMFSVVPLNLADQSKTKRANKVSTKQQKISHTKLQVTKTHYPLVLPVPSNFRSPQN